MLAAVLSSKKATCRKITCRKNLLTEQQQKAVNAAREHKVDFKPLPSADEKWVQEILMFGFGKTELPEPSKKVSIDELLQRDISGGVDKQFLADLVVCLGGEESVTIGSREVMKWKAENKDVYCLLNRPVVLKTVLSQKFASCTQIECCQGLLDDKQWEQVEKARKDLPEIVEL